MTPAGARKRIAAGAAAGVATLTLAAAAAAAPPAGKGPTAGGAAALHASKQAVAVLVCVEYRRLIGGEAFRSAFGDLKGCVEMVIPTGD